MSDAILMLGVSGLSQDCHLLSLFYHFFLSSAYIPLAFSIL